MALIGIGSATTTMAGSTTVLPLGLAIAEAYPAGGIDVSGGGTGAGIQGLEQGRIDIGMASRQITAEEKAVLPPVTETLVAYDGLVLIVSPGTGLKDITKEQLKGIYDGSITNWKQIGGNDLPVVAYGREAGSGTRDTFMEVVFGDKTAETLGEAAVGMGSAEIRTGVLATDGAIGYVGFSYANAIDTLSLDGVKPTVDTIMSKKYELARSLFLYTRQDAPKEVKDFLAFAISKEGQTIAKENGFIPR
jgi:phosphate transport system substrate-binding protein